MKNKIIHPPSYHLKAKCHYDICLMVIFPGQPGELSTERQNHSRLEIRKLHYHLSSITTWNNHLLYQQMVATPSGIWFDLICWVVTMCNVQANRTVCHKLRGHVLTGWRGYFVRHARGHLSLWTVMRLLTGDIIPSYVSTVRIVLKDVS